jgi:hypothetical protein
VSTEQPIPTPPASLPPIPAGPWRRWDGAEVVVLLVAQSPIDGGWSVVYVPRGGRGWEVYVEPAASWSAEVKPGVAKYVPGGPAAEVLARRGEKNGDGQGARRIMLSTVTCAYKVPSDEQAAIQMNAQAGMGIGQGIVNALASQAQHLRGNVLVSMVVQAQADGEEMSNLVIAPANALPKDPINRLPR